LRLQIILIGAEIETKNQPRQRWQAYVMLAGLNLDSGINFKSLLLLVGRFWLLAVGKHIKIESLY